MRTLIQRLLFLARRRRATRELDEELQFHLAMSGRALADEGLSAEAAREAAQRRLGSPLRVREQAGDVWIWRPLDALSQDVRYAVRVLRRQPRFVAAALATLALGIGANAAVFSLVDAMLLKPLPFADADRLVLLHASRPQQGMAQIPLSYLNFADARQRGTRTFEGMAAWALSGAAVEGRQGPEQVQVALATTDLFKVLGVTPVLGRGFAAEEEQRGAAPVAIIGHSLWQRSFGQDRAILGTRVMIHGRAHEIVGVLPAGFRFATFPHDTEVWMPIGAAPLDGIFFARGLNTFGGVGRLKPGVTAAQAQAELDTIANTLAAEHPDVNRGRGLHAISLARQASARVQTALLVLAAAVALLLLLACANVANLLLVRASARERELSVRTALGCSRARLSAQLLVEHLLLALCGGALGFGLAWLARDLLAQLPYNTPDLYTPYLVSSDRMALDGRVLLFTIGVSLATGLLFGLMPALRRAPTSLTQALASAGARATGDRRTMRLRATLIVAEVAVAAMLLSGMALMLASFARLRQVDPGLDPRGVVTVDLRLPPARYDAPHRIQAFYAQTLERLRALPGVTAAAAVQFLPFSGVTASTTYFVDGRPQAAQAERMHTHYRSVSDGYFAALGIPVHKGRAFSARDAAEAPRVALINEAMARQAFPNEDPIGKRLALDFETMRFHRDRAPDVDIPGGMREIVGVVADVHHSGLGAEALPEMYVPAAQRPVHEMTIVIRTASGDPAAAASAAGAARAIVRAIDPAQPIANVARLEDLVAMSIARPRFDAMLLSIFGALALLLAAVGVYGVTSYAVALRTRDLGIHIALGATPRDVWRMVVLKALRLTALGTIAGLAAAVAVSRVLSTLLFDVNPRDPWVFAAVAVVLGATSATAAWLPARRALRIDAMTALRAD